MPALSDYLLKTGPTVVQSNLWVRLVNNSTGASYISDAVTDANGKFSFTGTPPPPGIYTMYTGNAGTIPGTPNPTGDTGYVVANPFPTRTSVLDSGAKGDGVTDNAGAF